jgi:8-oxo-dGTP pyrophosphatase MutT (NUDIX family)
MKTVTLCFLVKEKPQRLVLLGLKKRGFGEGKYNGFGGKLNPNETIEQAAIRELYEEVKVKVETKDIKKVGELTFAFPFVPQEKGWDQTVHVFLAKKWIGEPTESEEMRPQWFDIDRLPFEKMWQDDQYWLPLVLQNKLVRAKFVFNEDNESIKKMDLDEIKAF